MGPVKVNPKVSWGPDNRSRTISWSFLTKAHYDQLESIGISRLDLGARLRAPSWLQSSNRWVTLCPRHRDWTRGLRWFEGEWWCDHDFIKDGLKKFAARLDMRSHQARLLVLLSDFQHGLLLGVRGYAQKTLRNKVKREISRHGRLASTVRDLILLQAGVTVLAVTPEWQAYRVRSKRPSWLPAPERTILWKRVTDILPDVLIDCLLNRGAWLAQHMAWMEEDLNAAVSTVHRATPPRVSVGKDGRTWQGALDARRMGA